MADTQLYGTMCTDVGNAAVANSVLAGTKVNFTQIAVGDANGTPYVPVSSMAALKHQVWSGPIGEVVIDPQQANRMILHGVLPSSVGGWVMREIGVLDDKGNLIAVGNTPEIPKEAITSGVIMEMDLCIYISVIDARGVNVIIDPTVVIASKADVNQLRQLLKDHKDDTVAHMTQGQKNQLGTAIQSATINGAPVSKSGTTLQLPPYPAIPGSLPANGGLSADTTHISSALTVTNAEPSGTLEVGKLWGVY